MTIGSSISRSRRWAAFALLTMAAAMVCTARAAAPSSYPSSSLEEGRSILSTRLRTGDITTTPEWDRRYQRRRRRMLALEAPVVGGGNSSSSNSNSSSGSNNTSTAAAATAAADANVWRLAGYRQYYLQLPSDTPFTDELDALRVVEALRGAAAGFVPDNSWHVLLPAGAEDALRARVPRARLVPILPRHKVSPEWAAVRALIAANATAKDALLAGATVTSLMRAARHNLTHYIGALQVEPPSAPGRQPRVHVRVYFPHLSASEAAALGFEGGLEALAPGPRVAATYAAALRGAVAAARKAGGQAAAIGAAGGADDYDGDGAPDGDGSSIDGVAGSNGGFYGPVVYGSAVEAEQQDEKDGQAEAGELTNVVGNRRRLVAVTATNSTNSTSNSSRSNSTAAASKTSNSSAAASKASSNQTAAGDACEPVVESGHFTMDVLICIEDLGPVLRWLARQPLVYWLSPRMRHTWENLAASAVTQGAPAAAGLKSPEGAGAAGLHPIWDAGLRGEGQIVGIGDSGVDADSCYFYDPKVPFAPERDADGVPVFRSDTHRKIALYYGAGDTRDAVGHGTHTSGTIAGLRYDTGKPDAATGMAPGARLAIIDMSSGDGGFVSAPDDLGDAYFAPTYGAGARVHSDSWGSDAIVYDYSSASLDRWLYEHPEFVSVFAAGNYGAEEAYRTTVTSPATSKNAIAVGAAVSPGTLNAGERTTAAVHSVTFDVAVSGARVASFDHRAVQAGFGGAPPRGKPLPLRAAAPQDACGAVAPVTPGSLLLVRRGGCYFSAKLANAAAAGAGGVLLTNDKQEGYFQMESNEDEADLAGSGIFMVGVPLSTGRELWALLTGGAAGNATDLAAANAANAAASAAGNAANAAAAAAATTLTATFSAPPRGLPAYEHIASFSSYGPTQDGRIKPDVIAPGSLISAKSDGELTGSPDQCSVGRSQGTSMATPVVAGSVALIRQYFMDGFYPTGKRTPGDAHTPSGPLIKAVLLGGASSMLGNTEAGLPLEPAPSFKQGFGRVNLTRALPLGGAGALAATAPRIQIVDMAALAQGESHRYCITALGGPLSITLVWYDYPGSPAAGGSMLVNDLDLEVKSAGLAGALLRGNGFADNLNPVERVAADDFPAGNVAIAVVGRRVPAIIGKQKYALVVQGRFTGVLASPQNPASGGATATGDGDAACVMTVPVISAAPAPLSKERAAQVEWTTKSGARPAGGFECKLAAAPPRGAAKGGADAAAAAAAAHDWRECASPARYDKLPDGAFTFSVRAAGEELADTAAFAVDATPPALRFAPSLGGADGAARPVSAAANASFAFSATDASPVTFECRLDASERGAANGVRATVGRSQRAYARFNGSNGAAAPPVGEWAPCASPLALWGLGFGDWSLSVCATDAAGNTAEPAVAAWATRFAPGQVYARVTDGSFGLVNTRKLLFEMAAITGVDDGNSSPAPTAPLEWALLPGGGPPRGADPSQWLPGTTPASLLAPADGSYVFVGRPAGGGAPDAVAALHSGAWPLTWAVMPVTVDTVAPLVKITAAPRDVESSRVATVRFELAPAPPGARDDGDGAEFACRWLASDSGPPAADAPEPPFGACSGGGAATPGVAAANVTDGTWNLFQVRATDAAGNVGPPANAAFRSDQSPPTLARVDFPNATNAGFVTIKFELDDGPRGSGVANVSCRMSLAVAGPADGAAGPSGAPGSPPPPAGAREADGEWRECRSPVTFLLPQDGRYTLQIAASDRAQLTLAPRDFGVVRDTVAPTLRIATSAPPGGTKLPRRVTVAFAGRDALSGVAAAEAMLTQFEPPAAATAAAAAQQAATAGKLSPGSAGGDGQRNSLQWAAAAASSPPPSGKLAPGARHLLRRLLQAAAGNATAAAAAPPRRLGNAYVHGTGAPVAAGVWLRSADPAAITLEELPSGRYTLVARGVDAAGNVGPATEPLRFEVDATLLLPEEIEARRRRTLGLALGLGLGGAAALLAIAGAVAAVRYKRNAPARAAAREREAAARRAQWDQWQAYHAGGGAGFGSYPPAAATAGSGSHHYAPHPWHDQQGLSNTNGYAPPAPAAAAAGAFGWSALGWGASAGGTAAAGAPAPAATPGAGTNTPVVRGRAAEIDAALLAELERRDAEDARVRAAMAASLEDEALRKAIAASLGDDADSAHAARGARGDGGGARSRGGGGGTTGGARGLLSALVGNRGGGSRGGDASDGRSTASGGASAADAVVDVPNGMMGGDTARDRSSGGGGAYPRI